MAARQVRFARWWWVAALLVVLLLAGCRARNVGAATERRLLWDSGIAARDFPLTVYQGGGYAEGEVVRLQELLQGGGTARPIVLNFWAGACPPCREEMPALTRLQRDLGERALVVGVDVGPYTGLGTEAEGRRLAADLEVEYLVGTTPDLEILKAYSVTGMPTTAFITSDGTLVGKHTGQLTHGQLLPLAEELIAGSQPSAPEGD